MKRRIFVVVLSVIMMISMTGCTGFFSNPVSLMSPPKSSGDLVEIEEALSAANGDYELSYPSSGNYRNAIIIRDFNGDGHNEALVFYQITDKNTITVHMNVLAYSEGRWSSMFDTQLSGTGIDRVEFRDVCGGNDDEILVGTKLYNVQEQELNIYKYDNEKTTLLTQERYTDYCVANIAGLEKPQIILFKISSHVQNVSNESKDSPIKKTVSAKLLSFSYEKDGVPVALGNAEFDSNIVSFSNISVAKIDENRNGVYVDAYVGAAAMITEVFYYDETIKASFYNKRTNSTDATYRDSLIGSRDIDKDGKVEIPKTYVCQGYTAVEDPIEKVYFTEWYGVNGEKLGERVACGFLNTSDNYFIKTPAIWLGTVTAQRNFDDRERVFCDWDFNKRTYGETLFSIRVFLKSEFNKNNRNYTKIKSDDEYVYAVKVNQNVTSQNKVTVDYLKENIILL